MEILGLQLFDSMFNLAMKDSLSYQKTTGSEHFVGNHIIAVTPEECYFLVML